jgi:hypothetical protein
MNGPAGGGGVLGPAGLAGLTPQQLQQLQLQQQRQQQAAVAAVAAQQQQFWVQQQMVRGQPVLQALHSPGLVQPQLLTACSTGTYSPALAAAAAAAAAVAAAADAAGHQQGHQQQQELDKKLCVLCQAQPRRVLLLPCKHLVACLSCSEALELTGGMCPICNQPFNRRVNVHGAG